MQELIEIVVHNGLGVASFLALMFFMYIVLKDVTKSLNDISTILVQIQLNLSQLNERVDSIEEKEI